MMDKRRKYEGEEELRLRLLEVTEDPTFGKPAPRCRGILTARGGMESAAREAAEHRETKVLH